MRHPAIYNSYPDVVGIIDTQDGEICYDSEGNQVAIDQSVIDAAVAPLQLQSVYRQKIQEINSWQTAQFEEVNFRYPPVERESWWIQIQEASAYSLSPSVSTPYIDSLVSNRGRSKSALVSAIIDKDAEFRTLSATVNGQAQALKDVVDAAFEAGDIAAIQAVVV